MNEFELKYKPFGERSILIEWPQIISENILESVLSYKQKLENYIFKEKVYIKSAYNSILITYNFTINNFYDEVLILKHVLLADSDTQKSSYKLWRIPVCYDLDFGIDLEEISKKNTIEISEIIRLHSSTIYRIYFLGFLPGFLYLGGLDNRLHFSRKNTPRLKVNKGSVAIGGSQTGIYPTESPGGWNIIGKTPIDFFNVHDENPCFAQSGDKIQFISVTKMECEQISKSIESKAYVMESEVFDG
ncbi:5-oxoprolinase subunit PxpB [Flavobacteriaceae bacterium S0825]|uniref:5-oxoprolinase subunit PxpB n=1 Tax=Gaetbulibacter sp. S0825 TaxID=2720084 RepID=UPI0014300BAB|nr:5-oxoprolinase subunit PxpB [Gaetbulibacter sp. S0825]MCK0109552.1 5-oxoprolinase subunit PxpB [Flavobacteriaceae bacterium S0825]NIX65185.1 5-oxoprolinase subunit PxpB [Gaetbulibacter sp. S0825]